MKAKAAGCVGVLLGGAIVAGRRLIGNTARQPGAGAEGKNKQDTDGRAAAPPAEKILAHADTIVERIPNELNLAPEQKNWGGFSSADALTSCRFNRARGQIRNDRQFLTDRAADRRKVAGSGPSRSTTCGGNGPAGPEQGLD